MKQAFSLVELLISLIIISILLAALAPVISKKLKNSSISLSQMNEITTECEDKFGEYCTLCTKKYCIKCEMESTSCADNEYPNTKTCACSNCSDWDTNCLECDSKGCTKCNNSPMRYVKDGKCEACPTGHYCDGSVDYAACPGDGYYCDTTGIHKCSAKYGASCTTCDADKCTSCDLGYYLNSSYVCAVCSISHCNYCSSPDGSSCNICNSQYFVKNGGCTSCSSVMAGCLRCSASNRCDVCDAGYFINSSKTCSSCSVDNCYVCKSGVSTPSCQTCNVGYYLSGSRCYECTVENCLACSSNSVCTACKPGYRLQNGACVDSGLNFSCSDSNFMHIGSLCITRKNMGDSATLKIPSTVTVADAGEYCYALNSKCCWKGKTSTTCDSINGNYSGCNRTVCNYQAAEEICSKFNYEGLKWRLATKEEIKNWYSYTVNLKDSGLMLCDASSGDTSASVCTMISMCPGSYYGQCWPYELWSGDSYNAIMHYTLEVAHYTSRTLSQNDALPLSVRCVAEME